MSTASQDIVTQVALSAGVSAAEAQALGEVAGADDAANALFAPQYQTENSPVHRAVWSDQCPIDLFDAPLPLPLAGRAAAAMDGALEVVRRHLDAGSFLNRDGDWIGKLSPDVTREVGALGYYGALVPEVYGGLGLDFPANAVVAERPSRQKLASASTKRRRRIRAPCPGGTGRRLRSRLA